MAVPGVRIRHITARNARFTIVQRDNPYPEPYHCSPPALGGCGMVHTHKTHHITLDDTGTAIVERVLFQKIKPYLIANGFEVLNEIKKPPTMQVGLAPGRSGDWGGIEVIHGDRPDGKRNRVRVPQRHPGVARDPG